MTTARLLITTVLLAALAACADRTLTDPRPDLARGGTGADPTVTATSPAGAERDTTLDIRVYGTGFDRGSRAELALNGVVGQKVRTNSTRYVSSAELVANVTIAADAVIGDYDVMVTVSTGKKGIGTEMFAVLANLAPIDLQDGTVGNHWGMGVSDAGWVFGLSGYLDAGGVGVVWRSTTPNEMPLSLPARVVNPQQGNGRGDYIAYDEDAVMLADGQGHWTLSAPVTAPAGWPPDIQMKAINDDRLVVGYGHDPNRCWTTTQGGTTSTTCGLLSPLAWTHDAATGNWTVFPMALPTPSDPAVCKVRGVVPTGVNDGGMVIGHASESALSTKGNTTCPQRAIVWATVSGPATALPQAGALSGYSYSADDVNDRGDISGTVYQRTDYRAIRWGAGTGAVEVLNGYYAYGEAIDECGRVATKQGYLWNLDGTVSVRLVQPSGFASLEVRDIANGLAVGSAKHAALGWHALVWEVGACQPAPSGAAAASPDHLGLAPFARVTP